MLTKRQQRFCEEYLTDPNGAQSAIRAGYSHRSARFTASRLLALPVVKENLAQLVFNRSDQVDVLNEAVMRKLWSIANADIKDVLTFDPQKVRSTDEPAGVEPEKNTGSACSIKDKATIDTRNIAEISLKANGDVKVKLGNREKALELLVRRLDMLSKAAGNNYRYSEIIEPIHLIPQNEEDTITD
jgi:phage terminase small subunit